MEVLRLSLLPPKRSKRIQTALFRFALTAVLDGAIRLAEIVTRQVRKRVALPPERVEVVQHPGKQGVRGPGPAVEFGRHAWNGCLEPTVVGGSKRYGCHF